MNFNRRRISPDLLSVFLLIVLWWLFFWRLFTLNPANALSLKEGDFSGQFVAWGMYQGERQHTGEVALWNPFNNSGHPFLADTQSGVFYPPRVLILALTWLDPNVTAGKVFNALQLEVIIHVLIASLLMYMFVRRLTKDHWAGLVAGLTFAYGGFLTGYPMLQAAVMGAVVWLPLMLLGVLEATREKLNPFWFGISGIGLALSLHAGSPQLSHWGIILTLIFLAERVYSSRRSIWVWLLGAVIFGGIGGGLAAVQLLPGLQFYGQSARKSNFTFDMQGNGFPPYDLIQMIFPGWLTLWSPLFFGVTGLALALLGVWRNIAGARFWAIIGGIVLLISFGRNTILWDILYNLPIGFFMFRQQERAAFPVAACASILAGLGTVALLEKRELPANFERLLRLTVLTMAGTVAVFFLIWQLSNTGDVRLRLMTFSLIIAVLTLALFWWVKQPANNQSRWQPFILIALITFDLFTVGHTIDNYDHASALNKLSIPAQVRAVQADRDGVFRVDGERGILENYGALYGLQDIRGTSPLRLDRYDKLFALPKDRLWEVLAVRYVFTPDKELPAPSQITGMGKDVFGELNVHRLNNPRPFARLVAHTWIEADDQAAINALASKDINIRETAILPAAPAISLPNQLPHDAGVTVTKFAPEAVTIQTHSSAPALLDVSLLYYPGWKATIDGQSTEVLRSNVALMAVALPAGDHTVSFVFAPEFYTAGALISLLTLVICGAGGISWIMFARRNGNSGR